MPVALESPVDSPLAPPAPAAGTDPHRFRALAIICIAQLMIVLDTSVVVIALPSPQKNESCPCLMNSLVGLLHESGRSRTS